MKRSRLSLLLICILTFGVSKGSPTTLSTTEPEKPYLWVYWENINRSSMPAVISLCRKTLIKHCSNSFKIVELDEKNIYTYLPQLKDIEASLNLGRLKIAQKVDFYRIYLLKEYGGVYLDSDMIVMRDLKEIAIKLEKYDYVGFGEYFTDKGPYNSYGAPQNWVMASQKNGILVNQLFDRSLNILQSTKHLSNEELDAYFSVRTASNEEMPWHSLGKALMRDALTELISTSSYVYYHYSNKFDGTRDRDGKFLKSYRIFEKKRIRFDDMPLLFFVFTSHQYLCVKEPHRLNMTEEQLLQEKSNFARFINISLNTVS